MVRHKEFLYKLEGSLHLIGSSCCVVVVDRVSAEFYSRYAAACARANLENEEPSNLRHSQRKAIALALDRLEVRCGELVAEGNYHVQGIRFRSDIEVINVAEIERQQLIWHKADSCRALFFIDGSGGR